MQPMLSMANTYRAQHVQGASPAELIVLLYDKAIVHLRTSTRHMQDGRLKDKGLSLCLAVDIIAELQAVLDKNRGGEIADKLDALYAYMLERLTFANLHNDAQPIHEVVQLLEELREGWRALAQPFAAAGR
jgi:flagellar secretion chaperone FliS